MFVLFTDFGLEGPYTGQVKAVLHGAAPGIPIIDLMADAPNHDPQSAAYLLAAYAGGFDAGTVFVCVVDPGVGGTRAAVALRAGGIWYVGPDNGLLSVIMRRHHSDAAVWKIGWQPEILSASFHGRDLFAPVAARLTGRNSAPEDLAFSPLAPTELAGADWPDDLERIVYIDRYGNALTGIRASALTSTETLRIDGEPLPRLRTFSDVSSGGVFCYENANGLMEIAVNGGRACDQLGLQVGGIVTKSGR